jgi:hypothetical protein
LPESTPAARLPSHSHRRRSEPPSPARANADAIDERLAAIGRDDPAENFTE